MHFYWRFCLTTNNDGTRFSRTEKVLWAKGAGGCEPRACFLQRVRQRMYDSKLDKADDFIYAAGEDVSGRRVFRRLAVQLLRPSAKTRDGGGRAPPRCGRFLEPLAPCPLRLFENTVLRGQTEPSFPRGRVVKVGSCNGSTRPTWCADLRRARARASQVPV